MRGKMKTPIHVKAFSIGFAILWTAATFYFCFGVLRPKAEDAIVVFSQGPTR